MVVKVRKARHSDLHGIGDMWTVFQAEHDAAIIKKNKKAAPYLQKTKDAQKKFEKFIKTKISSKNSIIHVAEDDGRLVAYSMLLINKNIPIFQIPHFGHFADLYVSRKYRGKGISSEFKKLALAWFKKKGIKYASIQVYCHNDHAKKIYERWGFFDISTQMRMKL